MALPAVTKPSRSALVQAAAQKNAGQSYLKYLPLMRKQQPPTAGPVDPFAQMGQAEQDALIRRTIGVMPTLSTPGQQMSQVQGLLDPVVRQITDRIAAQTKSGLAAVHGYSDQLAGNLATTGQQNVRDAFAPAEAGTAAANAALADRQTGVGNQNSDALAARLASINAPNAVDPAVAALRQSALGAGNATYATGTASLEQMLAQHGNAAAYANKLPDIARLTGLQQGAQVEGLASKSLAEQLAPVYGQIPGLVQNLRSGEQDKVNRYSDNKLQMALALSGQNVTKATAKAGLTLDNTKLNAPQTFGSGSSGYFQYDPTTQQTSQLTQPKPAATKVVGSASTGYFEYDPNTKTKTQLIAPSKTAAKTTKPRDLTPTEASSFTQSAQQIATNASQGGTDAKGVYHPPVSRAKALVEMKLAGLLADPRAAKLALKALNEQYGNIEQKIAASKVAGPAQP